jgi:hypothetical protein
MSSNRFGFLDSKSFSDRYFNDSAVTFDGRVMLSVCVVSEVWV